jgi:AIPR protein
MMASISADQLAILRAKLAADFVPYLPALIQFSAAQALNDDKNISRSLAAFAVAKLCGTNSKNAAEAVVDDGNDFGLDAIYYHGPSQTLFIIQAKLNNSTFDQAEALTFCQGLAKLIAQDFTGFNANVIKRQMELENAVSECEKIVPVIIHTGPGVASHATKAFTDFLQSEHDEDERVATDVVVLDSAWIVLALRESQSYGRINTKLVITPWRSYDQPRQTYFGFVPLVDLAKLYSEHGLALFSKNLRNPIGPNTDVAKAVMETLASCPEDFAYLNNGVTALCEVIEPKEKRKAGKRFAIRGLSVINGAQTISTAAHFQSKNPTADISKANVLITLIKADEDSDFGKSVTRARNHQNAVNRTNFAALDDEQERLRRDLAAIGLQYAYKADDLGGILDPACIHIDEAARALALIHTDPRYAVWLKKEPGQLLDVNQEAYKGLFTSGLTAFQLANAVFFSRYIQTQMFFAEKAAPSPEKLAYKHSFNCLGFVLAKCVLKEINGTKLLAESKIKSELSLPFDTLRQRIWDQTRPMLPKSALAIFRNQTHALPLLEKLLIDQYAVPDDARLAAERAKGNGVFGYPKPLFDYLCSKATQIGNLS